MELRFDGRRDAEPRLPTVELGHVPGAKGSVFYEAGDTVVIAAVHLDPKADPRTGSPTVALTLSPVVERPFAFESPLQSLLRALAVCALDTRVKPTALVLSVHVLLGDGSVAPAVLNAALLALMDAGIPLRSIPISLELALSRTTRPDAICVDPTLQEEASGQTALILLTMDGLEPDRVHGLLSQQAIHPSELSNALELSKTIVTEQLRRFRACLCGEEARHETSK